MEVICTDEGGSSLSRTTAKRLRFTSNLNVLVFKVIHLSGAHFANYRKLPELSEHVIVTVESQDSVKGKIRTPCHPKGKRLQNMLKAMMTKYQKMSLEAEGLSGVEAIYSDKEQLLVDILVEISDRDGNKRRDKEMKAQKENELRRAGEQLRDMAMKRKIEREGEGDMGGNDSSDRKFKRSKEVKAFLRWVTR